MTPVLVIGRRAGDLAHALRVPAKPGKPTLYDRKYQDIQRAPGQPARVLEAAVRADARTHARRPRSSRTWPGTRPKAGRCPGEAPENIVLRFEPSPPQEMYIAPALFHLDAAGEADEPDLWSFAAVTDDPPPEVAAAGHDRCIVQLRPENVEAWLTPAEHAGRLGCAAR